MSRLASILFAFAVTACVGDAADPASPFSFEPVAGRGTATDPGPRTRPDVTPPPARCLAVPSGGAFFGTSAHEELRDLVITPAGSILAAGYDRASWSPHGLFGARGIVLEIAPDLVGMTQVGVLETTGTDSFESIAIAPDTGKVWVVGRTNGELPDMPSMGGFDWVIGELTETGGFARLARGLESTSEYANRTAVGSGGLLAVAGHEQRLTSDGATSMDPFLAVYDTNDGSASPLWFTSRRQPVDESYSSVDVSDDRVVVGGAVADGDEQGMFVTAWDRDAGRLWRRQLSTGAADMVKAVTILPDGDVLWAGTAMVGVGDARNWDILVGKLDGATGDVLWTQPYGTAGDDQASDLAVDASGRIAVVGGVQAYTAEGPRGDLDAALFVLDPDGGLLLHEVWASDGDDRPTAVAMDACGGIALVGFTTGDLVDVAKGGRDAFVLVTHLTK